MAIKPPASGGKPPKQPASPPPAKQIAAKKGSSTDNTAPAPSSKPTAPPKQPTTKAISAKKGSSTDQKPDYKRTKAERRQAAKDYARTGGAVKGGKALPGTLGSGKYFQATSGGKVANIQKTGGKDLVGGTQSGGRQPGAVKSGTYSGDGGSRATRTSGNYTGGRASGGSYAGSGQPGRGSEQDAVTRGDSGGSTFSLGGTPAPRPGTSAVRPNFIGGNEGAGGQSGGATNPLAAGALSGLEGMNLEEVLHGAKKKGRIRRTRGTE